MFLTDEAVAQAKHEQEAHSESNAKDGMIHESINRPILINWDKRTLNERRLYWNAEYGNDRSKTVERYRICTAEVYSPKGIRYNQQRDNISLDIKYNNERRCWYDYKLRKSN